MSRETLRKAFDIGDIPDDIDLSIPPVTGMDYLYRVRLETIECPKVVVSNIDRTRFLSRQTVTVDTCNGFICAKPGFEPDPIWQKEQLDMFKHIRSEMAEDREMLKKNFPKRDFPKISKVEEWCLYSLGAEQHSKIFEATETDTSETSDQPKSKKPRLSSAGNPPFLSIMLYLNQSRITKLLSYHINWLDELGFSHSQGEWLYALLVCLEKPLDPDTCALLRSLSRNCCKLRDVLPNPEAEFLRPLNLIISIVAHCFDQKDMSDHFSRNNKL